MTPTMVSTTEFKSNILVFCTSIDSIEKKREVLDYLQAHTRIQEASVDLEDIDKVLRVVTDLCTDEIADLLFLIGITCTELL